MKKLLLLTLTILAASASAQTPAEVLQSHNNGVCLEAGVPLGAGCTDAAVLAAYCADRPAPCVDARAADAKVYTANAAGRDAFRDGVLLPGRYAEVFARKRGRVIERLNQLVLDPAKCAVILAAAGLDVSVCK